jgi:DNA-binding LacI/PurR family transcriptional regulator
MELEAWDRQVPPLRWGGDWTARSGYQAGVSLARDPDATAIFAANDQMAVGVIAALRDAGRRVPEDVSVVGFDDLPEAPYLSPPLTTVRQDFAELGTRAMGLLERVLGGEDRPSADLVPTALVVRTSTAPPRQDVASDRGAGRSPRP